MENSLKQFFQLPVYLTQGLIYHLNGKFFTPKPRMVQFPVCDRCNSRCIMCNRWQKDTEKEISIEKIQEVFSSSLFSKVESVGLHGGEPTLRDDLAEICKIIQSASPKLKQIWISTNGFGSKRIEKRIHEILNVISFKRLNSLEVNISIDGLEETHDKIRGIKGGFKQCIATIQRLQLLAKNYPLNISIGTVIQPLNLYQLDEIEKLADDLEVPIFFQPLMFDKFFNISKNPDLKFSKNDMEEFKKIIEKKLANGSSTTNFYWCDFLSMLKGANRKSPCAFDRYVLSLYPTGEILPCSREDWIMYGNVYNQSVDEIWYSKKSTEVRRKMKKEVCPNCLNYCGVEFSLQKEFFMYLGFYLKNRIFNIFQF